MEGHFFSEIDQGQFTHKDKQLMTIGVDMAKKSLDPAHGVEHIQALRDSFINFRHENSTFVQTDERVMAPAILFHDSFKTQAIRSTSTFGILLEEAYEGLGSSYIFKRNANKVGLEPSLISKVVYTIRKHSTANLLPRLTNEAKLLFDLDELDSFDINRYKKVFDHLKFSIDTQVKVAVSYLAMRSKTGFYFEWSNAVFAKKKDKFLEELHKFRDNLLK